MKKIILFLIILAIFSFSVYSINPPPVPYPISNPLKANFTWYMNDSTGTNVTESVKGEITTLSTVNANAWNTSDCLSGFGSCITPRNAYGTSVNRDINTLGIGRNNFSFAGWIRSGRPQGTPGEDMAFSLGSAVYVGYTNNYCGTYGFVVYVRTGDTDDACTGSTVICLKSNEQLETNAWYHIGVTYDAMNVSIYFNGTLKKSSGVTGRLCTADGLNYIGLGVTRTQSGSGQYWNGFIDDFNYWDNKVLLESDFKKIMINNFTVITPNTAPVITFNNQQPVDITLTNIINNSGVNISYNITDDSNTFNLSSVLLRYKTNNSFSNISYWIVNTSYGGYHYKNYSYNTSKTFNFNLFDRELFPANYLIDELTFYNTTNSIYTLASNRWLRCEFFNLQNASNLHSFEVMAEIDTVNNGYDLIYENEYGQRTTIVSNFIQKPNHKHPNSNHTFISFLVNDSRINGIAYTQRGYFIIKAVPSASISIGYLPNLQSYDSQCQTSINGVGWSNYAGVFNLHTHYFYSDTSVYYSITAKDLLGLSATSPIIKDTLELGDLPPTITFLSPLPQSYYNTVNLNLTYFSIIGNLQSSINVSLFNNTLDTDNEIGLFKDLGNVLNKTIDISGFAYGNYSFKVCVNDSQNLNDCYFSPEFEKFDNVAPTLNIINPVNNTVYTVQSVLINLSSYDLSPVTVNYDLNDVSYLYTGEVMTGSLSNGIYNLSGYVSDSYDNQYRTSIIYFRINYTPPLPPNNTGMSEFLEIETCKYNNTSETLMTFFTFIICAMIIIFFRMNKYPILRMMSTVPMIFYSWSFVGCSYIIGWFMVILCISYIVKEFLDA